VARARSQPQRAAGHNGTHLKVIIRKQSPPAIRDLPVVPAHAPRLPSTTCESAR
jgi:hypothetical protein